MSTYVIVELYIFYKFITCYFYLLNLLLIDNYMTNDILQVIAKINEYSML